MKRGPTLFIALTSVLAGVLGLAVLVTAFVRGEARRTIQEEARARGFSLDFAELDFSPSVLWSDQPRLSLQGVVATPLRAAAARAELREVQVELTRLGPWQFDVRQLDGRQGSVTLKAGPNELITQLQHWPSEWAQLGFPVRLEQVTVTWLDPGERILFTAADATLERPAPTEASVMTLLAATGSFAGLPMQELRSTLGVDGVTAGAHMPLSENEVLQVELELPAREPRQIKLSVAATDLRALLLSFAQRELSEKLPSGTVSLSAHAEALRLGDTRWQVKASARLDGFVPPHPVELNGFDFGDATHLKLLLVSDAPYRRAELSYLELRAGALELSGNGELELPPPNLVYRFTLRGALSCRDVAKGALLARDDSIFGRLFANAARHVVQGSVGIGLRVSGQLAAGGEPRIEREISVGCGLRPLREIEIEALLDSLPNLRETLLELGDRAAKQLPKPEPWPGFKTGR